MENFIRIGLTPQERARVHVEENIKIKLEIDVDPPLGFETEMVEMHFPGLYYIKSYSLPDLFAGKMSAVLARQWKGRVKGRDWYDLIWYVAKKVPLHLSHLEARLKQTGYIDQDVRLTPERFSQLYIEQMKTLDIAMAKADVVPFIRTPQILEVWSTAYFIDLLTKMTYC